LFLAFALSLACLAGAEPATRGNASALDLVYRVETARGETLHAHRADDPFNPASVVKVATTLWALERLGPEHRFTTRFALRGRLDRASGVLDGDLLVLGAGDPDFHLENAWLVARALNEAGVREIHGSLLVTDGFWIGWEGGLEGRENDPKRRARIMASRLRDALDSQRWNAVERQLIADFAARRGLDAAQVPRVLVRGEPGRLAAPETAAATARDVVIHRSNRLAVTLKRLNSYSNNDIERLETSLGPASELAAWLTRRWEIEPGQVRLSSLSGLNSNRMTARLVVRLMRDLAASCRRLGLSASELLPVTGCDPGTLEIFPGFDTDAVRGALTAKTGSLDRTDGGVAVLAGFLTTRDGERVFCVAAPGAAGRLKRARQDEADWVLDLYRRYGGARTRSCGAPLPYSDNDARVVLAGRPTE